MKRKKLALGKITVQVLSGAGLSRVQGGGNTGFFACQGTDNCYTVNSCITHCISQCTCPCNSMVICYPKEEDQAA
jgi:hypothetical protein